MGPGCRFRPVFRGCDSYLRSEFRAFQCYSDPSCVSIQWTFWDWAVATLELISQNFWLTVWGPRPLSLGLILSDHKQVRGHFSKPPLCVLPIACFLGCLPLVFWPKDGVFTRTLCYLLPMSASTSRTKWSEEGVRDKKSGSTWPS